MKTKIFFLTIILTITNFCQAQDYNSLLLNDAKFKRLDSLSAKFNTLHKDSIYSLSGLYDLKKTKLKDNILFKNCKGDTMSFRYEKTYEAAEFVHALGKIKLKNNSVGYLVYYKGYSCEFIYSIFLFVVNTKTKTCYKIKLNESYGCEGGMGDIDSWLVDNNKDGNVDILVQEKSESNIIEPDPKLRVEIYEVIVKQYCHRWSNGKFIKEKLSEGDFEKYKGFLEKSIYQRYEEEEKN